MKGVIFTEFLDMVDAQFSPECTERIVAKADLPSGGAYTAVGNYDHGEIVSLVTALSEETGVEVADLVHAYGYYLFGRFVAAYPQFFKGVPDALTFLQAVETHIHNEVCKLYPDASPPELRCETPERGVLIVEYRSDRGLADVAHGLICGCVDHFDEDVKIKRDDLVAGTHVRFEIRRRSH